MKPLVGVLYNPSVPEVIERASNLVECLELIPDRLWYDLGPAERGRRFRHVPGAIERVKRISEGRIVAGHGIGLALPAAAPLDREEVDQIAAVAVELDFRWYSEHLSLGVTPHTDGLESQPCTGASLIWDDETFATLRPKLATLRAATGCEMLLENGWRAAASSNHRMNEPRFFNRLYAELGCSMLLDLHNLYAAWRSGGPEPMEYLDQLNPACVREIHLGAGSTVGGFDADSGSEVTPHPVWTYVCSIAPTLRNLRAITLEFHESYLYTIGHAGIIRELEKIHVLAEAVEAASPFVNAC